MNVIETTKDRSAGLIFLFLFLFLIWLNSTGRIKALKDLWAKEIGGPSSSDVSFSSTSGKLDTNGGSGTFPVTITPDQIPSTPPINGNGGLSGPIGGHGF